MKYLMKMIPDPWEIKEVGFYLVFISFSQNYQKKSIFFWHGTLRNGDVHFVRCGHFSIWLRWVSFLVGTNDYSS